MYIGRVILTGRGWERLREIEALDWSGAGVCGSGIDPSERIGAVVCPLLSVRQARYTTNAGALAAAPPDDRRACDFDAHPIHTIGTTIDRLCLSLSLSLSLSM
jgi:hypothetical protein